MTSKAAPSRSKPKPKATPKAAPEPSPDIAIKVLRKSSCPSLSDSGLLDYEIGSDEANRNYFRIVANNAGGIFSSEWVPWTDIFAVCHNFDPLTSIRLRALFRGKSVKTAGFLMAALKDTGLIELKEGGFVTMQCADAEGSKGRHSGLTGAVVRISCPLLQPKAPPISL